MNESCNAPAQKRKTNKYTYTFSYHYQGSIDFNTVNIHRNIGMYSLDDIVSVHCREEGCIGKYTPRGPRDFLRAWILHP